MNNLNRTLTLTHDHEITIGNRYQVKEKIGAGAFGKIYRGTSIFFNSRFRHLN